MVRSSLEAPNTLHESNMNPSQFSSSRRDSKASLGMKMREEA